jgi:hypothetical protein
LVFEKLFVLKKHIKYLKKDCRFKRKLDWGSEMIKRGCWFMIKKILLYLDSVFLNISRF